MAEPSQGAGLLPCPFCGGEADEDAPSTLDRLIHCKRCFASICEDSTPNAVAAWNRRSAPTKGDGASWNEDQIWNVLAKLEPLTELKAQSWALADARLREILTAHAAMLSASPPPAEAQEDGGKQ